MPLELDPLLASLEALGHPRLVAVRLYKEGFRGRRGHGLHCPLARFVACSTGALHAEATSDLIVVRHLSRTEVRTLPPTLKDFVDWFDMGRYPELVEPHPGWLPRERQNVELSS